MKDSLKVQPVNILAKTIPITITNEAKANFSYIHQRIDYQALIKDLIYFSVIAAAQKPVSTHMIA